MPLEFSPEFRQNIELEHLKKGDRRNSAFPGAPSSRSAGSSNNNNNNHNSNNDNNTTYYYYYY